MEKPESCCYTYITSPHSFFLLYLCTIKLQNFRIMAKYTIECEQFLGFSHCGPITTTRRGTIELTDEEVATLVQLIREKNTTDVGKLGLKDTHPDLYGKLDDAYGNLACYAEYMHWLWDGYENGYYEYDETELMHYCESKCGFSFEYDEKDYLDAKGEVNQEVLACDKSEAFCEWLDGYVRSLSDDDAADFFSEHMDADIDVCDVEYSVDIPDEIVQMAKG